MTPLVHIADLMHLTAVICRTDNWRVTFAATFGNKPASKVSTWRLAPVWNTIAHNRPLLTGPIGSL